MAEPAQTQELPPFAHREKRWTRLSHDDDVHGVVVSTREGDRFVVSVEEAINACKQSGLAKEFFRQLSEVFERLSAWLDVHRDAIDRAYLSLSDEGVDFTAIQRCAELDQAVDDSLVDLDIAIAQSAELDLIKLDVMSLPLCPEENARSFVRPRVTWMRRMHN